MKTDSLKTCVAVLIMIAAGCSQRTVPAMKTEIVQGITMVSVPGGTFAMGHAYVNDPGADLAVNVYFPEEQPVHTVTLSAFSIGATEITREQYALIMGENPSTFSGDPDLPVTNLGASKALEFCNRLSESAGLDPCYDPSTGTVDFSRNGFRLPTEAEWEYACRAGSDTQFSSGNTSGDLDRAGWFRGNSGGSTHPVGQKEANAWGLYDMHGNVAEWCLDWHEGSLGEGAATDPPGPTSGDFRATRGGDWDRPPRRCRSAYRDGKEDPYDAEPTFGFRLSVTVQD